MNNYIFFHGEDLPKNIPIIGKLPLREPEHELFLIIFKNVADGMLVSLQYCNVYQHVGPAIDIQVLSMTDALDLIHYFSNYAEAYDQDKNPIFQDNN